LGPLAEEEKIGQVATTTAVAVVPPKTFAGMIVDETYDYRISELIEHLLVVGRLTPAENAILQDAVNALRKSLSESHC
jgi:hypothetical protein